VSNPYRSGQDEERFAPRDLPPVPRPEVPGMISDDPSAPGPSAYPGGTSQSASSQSASYQGSFYQNSSYQGGFAQGSSQQGPSQQGASYQDTFFQGSSYPSSVARPVRARVAGSTVVGLMVASVLAGAAAGAWSSSHSSQTSQHANATITQVAPGGSHDRPAGSVADVAAKVLPSVVYIEIVTPNGVATGSGFVLSDNGYILTNNHVVAEAVDGAKVTVTFADGSEEPATLVGRTVEYDLAVIKVNRTGLKPLTLGDSDALVVGDPVIAIGAPLGLEGTVTTGIVSALNRPVTAGDQQATAYINAIQTDAAINPGNSGGPLVNGAGEVIGINSAIAQTPNQVLGTTAGNIGLGFAIASNQATRTAQQIIKNGYATYPIIGVLLDTTYTGQGVQVSTSVQGSQLPITPNGPADHAGILAGDIILAIDGQPVSQSDELIVVIRSKAPGDTVTLTLKDGDSERDVQVTLGEAKSQ